MQSGRKRLVIGLIGLSLALGLPLAGWYLYLRDFRNRHDDYYAPLHAAWLVIDHLETHENQWPTSWDDLRAAHDRIQRMANPDKFFSEIQNRVVVDWEVDIDAFMRDWEEAQPGTLPAAAVRLRRLDPADPEAVEPDRLIYEHLSRRKKVSG